MYFYNSLVIRRLTDTHRVLRIVYQSDERFRHTAYAAVLHADATACVEHADATACIEHADATACVEHADATACVEHADATACVEHALSDNGIGDGFCAQTSAEVWRSEPAYLLLCTVACECMQLDCLFAV